jgi:putative SOS response-associated peptidase YedK
LPADGFYEWYAAEPASGGPGRGKPRKQPFFIHRSDGGLLVMAGLYEIWRDPGKPPEDDSAWLRTCSVITTEATDAAGHIHDRMPMVITRDAIDAWLDPEITDPERALELLQVTEASALEAYGVSTEVNSVENNNPSLVQPLASEPEQQQQHDQETLI